MAHAHDGMARCIRRHNASRNRPNPPPMTKQALPVAER